MSVAGKELLNMKTNAVPRGNKLFESIYELQRKYETKLNWLIKISKIKAVFIVSSDLLILGKQII